MNPNQEQAQAAFGVIDRAVSGMDCKGLSLVQTRDLIAALQCVAAYIQPAQVATAAPVKAEAPPIMDDHG